MYVDVVLLNDNDVRYKYTLYIIVVWMIKKIDYVLIFYFIHIA